MISIGGAMKSGARFGAARAAGFTLIELMIVVVVVAILVAIAYPSYLEQVRKSRRALAKADLVEYAQMAERFHTVNNTYVGFNLPSDQVPREAGATPYYSLAITAQAANAFTFEATPEGNQVSDTCGTLSLNQAGVKGSEDGATQNPKCF